MLGKLQYIQKVHGGSHLQINQKVLRHQEQPEEITGIGILQCKSE